MCDCGCDLDSEDQRTGAIPKDEKTNGQDGERSEFLPCKFEHWKKSTDRTSNCTSLNSRRRATTLARSTFLVFISSTLMRKKISNDADDNEKREDTQHRLCLTGDGVRNNPKFYLSVSVT